MAFFFYSNYAMSVIQSNLKGICSRSTITKEQQLMLMILQLQQALMLSILESKKKDKVIAELEAKLNQ
ncbi:hypothetical protein [Macrococcus equipercicus]|uniref:Uncharacterized protein n=1 Tax=Macrococcus equipercicus TaxID=69967 RepID=A0A9Q9F1A1_9STAP|nr:hypothetical protein [Macrococcus equipercicus]UTH13166.1 hypothetical protein KFV11_07790 [Macrococcus equipercicus]